MSKLDWQAANQQYLIDQLNLMRVRLECYRDKVTPLEAEHAPAMQHGQPAALDVLCDQFDLTSFERDVLLLCAGVELEGDFAPLCAAAQGDPRCTYATFSLALSALPDAHWSAASADQPLRYWHLIEVEPARHLVYSPLRIDERILLYLMGVTQLDQHLQGLVHPLAREHALPPSHRQLAEELAATWSRTDTDRALPILQLCGPEIASKRDIAATLGEWLGAVVDVLPAAAVPPDITALDRLIRAWQRETLLSNRVLYLECDLADRIEASHDSSIVRLIETLHCPLIVSNRDRRLNAQQPLLTCDVHKPAAAEQLAIWHEALGERGAALEAPLHRLVAQFDLSAPAIETICAGAANRSAAANPDELSARLWEMCRAQARPQLDDLAQRIEPIAAWDDLIIPEAQRDILHEIAMQVRQRTQVYDVWNFCNKSARGLGISALFSGISGAGKTMAAEVLARELQLDLYRIDLSAVVSKYVGETEKNLRRVFDAAENSSAILLFDEADALFGKRSEVKDSHDRYANIEISYLLQRMEAYRGLAILTTNLKDTLDTAFLRRIRFIVQFPFPDAAQRAEIWRGVFPAATPIEALDPEKLAQLNVAGGNIRNIALHAAFIAADAGEPVRMNHVLQAARREYLKLEKPLTSAEIRGWDEAEH